MNQRDRAFLSDMNSFICLNRPATVFALLRTLADPGIVTRSTMKYLRFNNDGQVDAPEELLNKLIQDNTGNIQGVMIARIYAELLAGYEDLGIFGSAIKNRKSKGKGIFEKYIASERREAASFLEEILRSNVLEDPKITLDILLNIPPAEELNGIFPQYIHDQLISYYQDIPKYLYQVAAHYRAQRKDVKMVKKEDIPTLEPQINLSIILGFVPPNNVERKDRLTTDVFNRIKHQFLLTGNLEAYNVSEDPRRLEYATLQVNQAFTDGIVDGVISIARVMSDFASILLLLDSQGVNLY